jgi:hypothetical protein
LEQWLNQRNYKTLSFLLLKPLLMNKLSWLFAGVMLSLQASAQNNGPTLLFANSNSRLADAEKKLVYQKLQLKPAPGGSGFLSGDFDVEAHIYPTDINGDGIEDVFVVMSSAGLYGNTGQGFVLFMKNAAGSYTQREFSGPGIPAFLKTKSQGVPDLLVSGAGFEHPVYRWNGSSYGLHRTLKDGSAESNTAQYLEDYSAAYVKSRK